MSKICGGCGEDMTMCGGVNVDDLCCSCEKIRNDENQGGE